MKRIYDKPMMYIMSLENEITFSAFVIDGIEDGGAVN